MSIDINWDTLTQGPDGEVLSEAIRSFIDDKFQKVTLPRMIRSVKVHSFDFGHVPPQIELKDVCDPLPDFYEGEEDEDEPVEMQGVSKNADDQGHNAIQKEDHANARRDAHSNAPGRNLHTPCLITN